jgi:hypothetical protein
MFMFTGFKYILFIHISSAYEYIGYIKNIFI